MLGAKRRPTTIEVGPSAAPMMAMALAFLEGEVEAGQLVEQNDAQQRAEDAELRRGSQQHDTRTAQQRAEVGHRADAHEDQQRQEVVLDAGVVDQPQQAIILAHAGEGGVDEETAEADGHQQQRLEVPGDAQIEQHQAHDQHDGRAPLATHEGRQSWSGGHLPRTLP